MIALPAEKAPYGSVEYYAELFSDIVSDVGCYETVEQNVEEGRKILAAFDMAMQSWITYHSTAAVSFQMIKNEYMKEIGMAGSTQESLRKEEDDLPDLPEFPNISNIL